MVIAMRLHKSIALKSLFLFLWDVTVENICVFFYKCQFTYNIKSIDVRKS